MDGFMTCLWGYTPRVAADQLAPASKNLEQRSRCLTYAFVQNLFLLTRLCGSNKVWEPAGKPGSVVGNHSSGTAVTNILKRPTRRHRGPRYGLPIWSCSGWGLPCHKLLPVVRCALTAPFHPYLHGRRYIFCCTFRRLTPPRCYLAPCPVEPGLSSLPHNMRKRDCLAGSRRLLSSNHDGIANYCSSNR
ncbi:MAG: hypothetical protein BMS9Abin30_1313 [Gammaproteobacteria bacterium]|nr:MAG: hypothetical protein BMS9Abin30_1313 [Gammaproteobacteria bacterium]